MWYVTYSTLKVEIGKEQNNKQTTVHLFENYSKQNNVCPVLYDCTLSTLETE